MNQVYDAQYFIDKFEKIPEELWNEDGHYAHPLNPECKCALGHLGYHDGEQINKATPESDAFQKLFTFNLVTEINDGGDQDYQQPTPKQRVLAALRDVQKGQPNE